MPAEAARAVSEGNRLRKEGRLADAVSAYRRAVALSPEAGDAHYNLGIALREAGELREAALEFRAAARLDPRDMDAVQNVVETLARAAERGARLFPPVAAASSPSVAPFSIVVCSARDDRLARMHASFRAALAGRDHEFVVIRDARSLSEGYQRGLAAARHERVVLCHDDVELASADPFAALQRALEGHDIVGLAGSRLVSGPAVLWAGQPHLFGGVAYPVENGIKMAVYSLATGVLPGMQALDGLLVAVQRPAALSIGFDAETFDGFHFYDLDFVYRAHLAGLRIAVSTGILAIHASEGRFDEDWNRYAQRFMRKFPRLAAPKGPSFSFARRLATREQAMRFHEDLNAMGAIA